VTLVQTELANARHIDNFRDEKSFLILMPDELRFTQTHFVSQLVVQKTPDVNGSLVRCHQDIAGPKSQARVKLTAAGHGGQG